MSYRIEAVASSRSPELDVAYAALAAEFAPRGELERREVIARWLDEPASATAGGLRRSYHLLVARDAEGTLAGVRDCHVVLDPAGAVAVVYLAHVLVMPAFRRSGLGALFRSEPLSLAKRDRAAAGIKEEGTDLLLAAEMEPVTVGDEASVVRLVAYGKERFAAIAPSALPYCQPDFRDLRASPGEPRPIPLLAVVRHLGHEGARTLPARLARAFVRHLYAVFATHVRAEHLAALERRTLGVLGSRSQEEILLLPLPRTTLDRAAVLPLERSTVLSHFPEELR